MSLTINSNMLGQFSDWLISLFCLTISFLLSSSKTLSFSRRPPTVSFASQFCFFSLLPKPSLFLADHLTYLRKTMISDSFTVWSSWNLSTMFAAQFRAFSPLGILISCLSWEKYLSHCNIFLSRRNSKWSQ